MRGDFDEDELDDNAPDDPCDGGECQECSGDGYVEHYDQSGSGGEMRVSQSPCKACRGRVTRKGPS